MSRIYGFLGGVLTTSSIAYLTALEFRKNSAFISGELKASQSILDNHGKIKIEPLQPIEYEARLSLKETMKDVWNDEIIKGVNWFYGIQWNSIAKRVENGAEKAVNYVKTSVQ
ncbi:hypothetical protein D0Z00_002310 [Geotrichum galactomycetum]|uniref:Uncharacterized protein n=1 Tax=Geotrichum galactomycetum TaxID=27317 RepID=A0ACB6V4I6_9ASCO|nr:hypothetical protein D0Z00_002310 [Geotrichum candidum]